MTEQPGDYTFEELRARWRAARTLAEIGELTAQFLEGTLRYHPSHAPDPDPETIPLAPVLAAVNRAGFVTTQSQPGEALDEHGSAQRANVSGFAASETYGRLMAAVADLDLIITAVRGQSEDLPASIPITLDQGEEFTWDGGGMGPATLGLNYEDDHHPDAIEELLGAWQVTLTDPVWGRNDVLWAALQAFATPGADMWELFARSYEQPPGD